MRTLSLNMYGVIGEEVNSLKVRQILEADPKAKAIIRINSDGGFVDQGMAIYQAIIEHKGEVETICDGVAASMASLIFMSGDVRKIIQGGYLMIHNPYTGTIGDDTHLTKIAEHLRSQKENLAKIYAERSGVPLEAILEMMAEETYLTAEQAKSLGFVHEILPATREASKAMAQIKLEKFKKPPEALVRAVAQAKHPGHTLGSNTGENNMDPKILEMLGLPPDATPEQQMQAVQALITKAASAKPEETAPPVDDPEKLEEAVSKLGPKVQARIFALATKAAAVDTLATELKALKDKIEGNGVEDLIKANTNKIPQHLETWARKQPVAVLKEFLAHAVPIVPEASKAPALVKNEGEPTESEKSVAKALGCTVAQLRKDAKELADLKGAA